MSSNWWSKKLQGNPAPSGRVPVPVHAPPPTPVVQHQAPVPRTQRPPASSLSVDTCPGCGSGNYMASPPGSRNYRCFECGYPVVQSGSGVVGTSSDAPVRKAVQVDGAGYNPTLIVGKVE